MKRILCLVLVLLVFSAMWTACDSTDAPEQTAAHSTDVQTSGTAEAIEPEETLDIPLTADYEGYEFNILSVGNQVFNDFDFEEESSLPLDNAQYKRKVKVEEDYNVKINATVTKKHSTGRGPGYQAVNKQVHSGDCDYDLCIIAGYDVSTLAYSGLLYDMQSIGGIDLSKSWWDRNATDSLTVQGVTFFTTGEITVSDNRAAYCILFNKQLLANYNLDSPYDMVDDGTWTIESFGKLVRSVSEDLNQDGMYTQADRYGLLVWDDSVLGMINAAGQRCCTVNSDTGEIELTLYTESTLSAFDQYIDFAYDQQHAFHYQRVSENTGSTMWKADQALFWTKLVHELPELREMETDFGVLPYPKLSETQENYYTTISPFNSNFVCIPLVQEDADRTGVIAEALAYYGKQFVTPALYDITLVGQSTRDEESEPMLEIIFDNLIYDIGYYYQIGGYNERIMDRLRARETSFTSMYDTYKMSASALLKVINKQYASAVAEWKTDTVQ